MVNRSSQSGKSHERDVSVLSHVSPGFRQFFGERRFDDNEPKCQPSCVAHRAHLSEIKVYTTRRSDCYETAHALCDGQLTGTKDERVAPFSKDMLIRSIGHFSFLTSKVSPFLSTLTQNHPSTSSGWIFLFSTKRIALKEICNSRS